MRLVNLSRLACSPTDRSCLLEDVAVVPSTLRPAAFEDPRAVVVVTTVVDWGRAVRREVGWDRGAEARLAQHWTNGVTVDGGNPTSVAAVAEPGAVWDTHSSVRATVREERDTFAF